MTEVVQGVPGPLHTTDEPSPAYQVIFRGAALASMVSPPAEARAVWVCHQPGCTHHHTGTWTNCVVVKEGLAAMTGRGIVRLSTARCVITPRATGGWNSVTMVSPGMGSPVAGSRQVLIHWLAGRKLLPSLP